MYKSTNLYGEINILREICTKRTSLKEKNMKIMTIILIIITDLIKMYDCFFICILFNKVKKKKIESLYFRQELSL